MQPKPARRRAAPAPTRTKPRAKPVTLEQAPQPHLNPPALRTVAEPPVAAPAPSASPTLDAHGHDPDAYDWVPVPRAQRTDGWTPERQRAFIGALADTGSVRTAAQQSGMSPSTAYRLRRAPEGRSFALAWDAAIQQAAAALVDAAFERAVHGSEEPVWDRKGRVIGRRFRQSDAMMMFLLRKHFPDRYGDNYRDRAGPAISSTAVPPPPVADALALLGPVVPDDPAATLDPDMLDLALARADAGKHPDDPTAAPDAADEEGLGPDFEAALEAAKAAANAPTDDWNNDGSGNDADDWDEEEKDDDEEDPDDFADPDTV